MGDHAVSMKLTQVEYQLVLLGLANLGHRLPDMRGAAARIAEKFDGKTIFDELEHMLRTGEELPATAEGHSDAERV